MVYTRVRQTRIILLERHSFRISICGVHSVNVMIKYLFLDGKSIEQHNYHNASPKVNMLCCFNRPE